MYSSAFTPKTWYSEDGKWKFIRDRHGMIDMIPVGSLDKIISKYSKQN